MKKVLSLSAIALIFALSACDFKGEKYKPMADSDRRLEERGRLTGDEGMVLSGERKDDSGAPGAIGVNIFLWRATLDTLSFMPISSADPFGGTILTDWYEDPKTPGERFKVNAVILDKSLRADGVKVKVFKQRAEKAGNWRNQQVDDKLARSLEDTILTRARQLRVAQLGR